MADFAARVSGTPQEPILDAHVRVKGLALDKERAGDFYFDATTRGRVLDLKGHSDFDRSNLKLQGTVEMRQDFGPT